MRHAHLLQRRYNEENRKEIVVTIAEAIKQTVEALPPEKQRAVLQFAKSLDQKPAQGKRRSLRGFWKGVKVTSNDISEMRKEAWGSYMREAR
jgi:hypothetical protein